MQEFKTELGGHCRCGFRHVSASLRMSIFLTLSYSRMPLSIPKTVSPIIAIGSCKLMVGLKDPIANRQWFQTPNSPLTSTLTSLQLLSNFVNS